MVNRKNKGIDEKFTEDLQASLSLNEQKEDKRNKTLKLEQLEAQIDALNEVRKVSEERFLRVAEEVGQLKESIVSREKEIKDLSIKISKSLDIISKIQPEKIYEFNNLQEKKFNQMDVKIEGSDSKINLLIETLKTIKTKLDVFQGIEQIIELNKESTHNIQEIQKISAITKEQSNKTQNFFIRIEKWHKEFEQFKEERKNMQTLHIDLINQINTIQTVVAEMVKDEELTEFKSELHENEQLTFETINELKLTMANIHEKLELLENKLVIQSRLETKNENNMKHIKQTHGKFIKIDKQHWKEIRNNNKDIRLIQKTVIKLETKLAKLKLLKNINT